MLCKSIDLFLYDRDLCHERVSIRNEIWFLMSFLGWEPDLINKFLQTLKSMKANVQKMPYLTCFFGILNWWCLTGLCTFTTEVKFQLIVLIAVSKSEKLICICCFDACSPYYNVYFRSDFLAGFELLINELLFICKNKTLDIDVF